jgi:hypothetical protein
MGLCAMSFEHPLWRAVGLDSLGSGANGGLIPAPLGPDAAD